MISPTSAGPMSWPVDDTTDFITLGLLKDLMSGHNHHVSRSNINLKKRPFEIVEFIIYTLSRRQQTDWLALFVLFLCKGLLEPVVSVPVVVVSPDRYVAMTKVEGDGFGKRSVRVQYDRCPT